MIQNNVADDTGTRATLIDPAPIRDTKISSMTKYNFISSADESKNFEKAEIEQISKAVSGGFRVIVRSSLLDQPVTTQSRRLRTARMHLGVTGISRRSPAYRA